MSGALPDRYAEVIRELKSLEGHDDEASMDRREELLEELMELDMAAGPIRKAMIEGAKNKENS